MKIWLNLYPRYTLRSITIDLATILRQNRVLFLVNKKFGDLKVANSPQAKKRARQAENNRANNTAKRSEMRTYLKQVTKAAQEGNKSLAATIYKKAASMVDRLVGKGIIHKNKAARHKSRLNARIKDLEKAQ